MSRNLSPKKQKQSHLHKSVPKATQIIMEHRIEHIKKLRLAEYTLSDILKNPIVRKWKVSEASIIAYISKADKKIMEYKRSDLPKWIKECEQKLRSLYLINFQKGNYVECRKILETANRILGYEKLKVEMEQNTNINISITKEMEDPKRIEEVILEAINADIVSKETLEKILRN